MSSSGGWTSGIAISPYLPMMTGKKGRMKYLMSPLVSQPENSQFSRLFTYFLSGVWLGQYELSGQFELGTRKLRLKPCMFTWAKIGCLFEIIILAVYSKVFHQSFDMYKVFNHHLVRDYQ